MRNPFGKWWLRSVYFYGNHDRSHISSITAATAIKRRISTCGLKAKDTRMKMSSARSETPFDRLFSEFHVPTRDKEVAHADGCFDFVTQVRSINSSRIKPAIYGAARRDLDRDEREAILRTGICSRAPARATSQPMRRFAHFLSFLVSFFPLSTAAGANYTQFA